MNSLSPWLRRVSHRLTGWILLFTPCAVARAHVTGDATHDAVARLFAREFPSAGFAIAQPAAVLGAVLKPISPMATEMFAKFAPAVHVRAQGDFLFIESNGLPAHNMMVGITAWQQQVPLPQPYTDTNAWRIPLRPQPASVPVSIKNRFLRGAIAIAANGVPIFNPQNNRGEISQEIGELDQWGGHCGRSDDYHYHAAPLHLQSILGKGLPVAFALDGYAIYGLTEPDGSAPKNLDAFNGHETSALGYHYHASLKYPYVNGGFHGMVVELEGQVDPQPRAQGVRPALMAVRGAKITAFDGTPGQTPAILIYSINGRPAAVKYEVLGGGQWKFQFGGEDGGTREEIYRADNRSGGNGGRDGRKQGGPTPDRDAPAPPATGPAVAVDPEFAPPRTGNLILRSPAVGADGVLPTEFTGDGASLSPPLEWTGAPPGTRSFAVIMHHIDPEGVTKWYWTLYNLPADTRSLPKDVHGVGVPGNNSITGRAGYAPPHSKGSGAKTYVLTVYALAEPLHLSQPPADVSRAVLLATMQGLILDSAELKVTYSRPDGATSDQPPEKKVRSRP